MAITKLESSRDFFRIWFLWKKKAIYVFLTIVGLVMLYAYTATPQFESIARIMLLPKTNQELVLTAGNDQRQVIQKVTQEDLKTEIDLLRSKQVIQNTIKSFENNDLKLKNKNPGMFATVFSTIKSSFKKILIFLKLKEQSLSSFEAKVDFLQKSLTVDTSDSNILEVTLTADNPKQSAVVLQSILEHYIEHHNKVFSIQGGYAFYNDQTDSYKTKLAEAELGLKEFYENWNIIDLGAQNAANIALFSELTKELRYVEIAYDEALSRITILEEMIPYNGEGEILLTKEMRTIPSIIEFEKGIVPMIIKRAKLSQYFTEESREFKDITEQIKKLRQELRVEVKKTLQAERIETATLKAKKDSLQNKIIEIQEHASILKKKERELTELQRQVDLQNNNYIMYANKTESSRVYSEKKNQNLASLSIVDPPSVSLHPVSPKRMMLLILSLFCGFIASLIVPFVLESIDQKLKTVDDIEIILELPVISTFAKIKK